VALGARAQDQMRRIGVLLTLAENDPEVKASLTAFQEGLQQAGVGAGSQCLDRLPFGEWRSRAPQNLRG